MYAKLFSRITESSLMEEPIDVRYTFTFMLAICDPTGHVIGTDVAIARRLNMALQDFQRCVAILMSPDSDSNSKEEEGRRIIQSDGERGYKLVNYLAYREMKDEDNRRVYMRDYMKKYREKPAKLAPVNIGKHRLGQEEVEEEVQAKEKESHQPTPLSAAKPPRAGVTEGKAMLMLPTTPQSKRIATIFHRKLETGWNEKEVRAYKKIGTVDDEDMTAVEAYYAAHWPPNRDLNILRHDLMTFLNNFQGEVGRAKVWAQPATANQKPKTAEDVMKRTP